MDLAGIGAFLTAAAALLTAGYSALKARAEHQRTAKKDDLEALRLIVNELQEENGRLVARINALETENVELRERVAGQEKKIEALEHENEVLTAQLQRYRRGKRDE